MDVANWCARREVVSLFAKLSAELPIDREIAALKIRHIILAAQEKRSAIADALADGEWQGGRGGDERNSVAPRVGI